MVLFEVGTEEYGMKYGENLVRDRKRRSEWGREVVCIYPGSGEPLKVKDDSEGHVLDQKGRGR